MEKLKQYKYIILIALIATGFLFYWFQLLPASVRKLCIKKYPYAFYEPRNTGEVDINPFSIENNYRSDKSGYQKCLRENGIDE